MRSKLTQPCWKQLTSLVETLPPGGLLEVPRGRGGGDGEHLSAQAHLPRRWVPAVILNLEVVKLFGT